MTYAKCPHCKYEFDAEDIWHAGSTELSKREQFNRPIREPVSIDGETMNMVLDRVFLAPINIFASVDDDGEVVGYAAAFNPENIKDENARPFFEEWVAHYQPEKEVWRLFEDTGSLITTLLDCLVGYYEHLASLDKVPEKP